MRSWQALMGIGLIVAYSVVMMVTGGSAPFAWMILGAAFVLLAVQASRIRAQEVDRD